MLAPKPREEAPFKVTIKKESIYDDGNDRHYMNHPCSTAYVKDALANEIDYWRYWNPVLIRAGTGKGKSTFACEELIPRAQRSGENVVILSNRNAVNLQQKREVIRCTAPELEDQLTDKGIRDRDIIGNTAVILYQSLHRFLNDPKNKEWLANVRYLVADECHYFCADAGFNRNCGYHLKLILDHFKYAIRIYMTATDWSVLYPLYKAEASTKFIGGQFFGQFHERCFHRYCWAEDFSHVDLHFVGGLDEIKQLIIRKPDEKFLLFVDSKEKGKAFARELGSRAIYLDADSKSSKTMEKLLRDNAFKEQVLVTTKVLDCGVNIWDNRLRNVAVMTEDRTSMVQMLGRKRCKPGERVNLYVCDVDRQVLLRRHREGCELLEAKKRYEFSDEYARRRMRNEIWNGDDDRLRLYFKLSEDDIFPNRMAFYALIRKLYFYEEILLGEKNFRRTVCSWFRKTPEPEVPEKVPEDELQAFCEAHLGMELTEKEIVTARALIVKAAGATGFVEPQPTRVTTLGRDALNNRMAKFGCAYRFEKNVWKLNKEE